LWWFCFAACSQHTALPDEQTTQDGSRFSVSLNNVFLGQGKVSNLEELGEFLLTSVS